MTQETKYAAADSARTSTDVVLRLAGESGEGVVSLGDLTVQMLVQMGLDIYTFQTFPAEIKGGTVMYQIRATESTTLSHGDAVDVFVALNHDGFSLFGEGLRENGILVYDSDVFTPVPEAGRTEYALPISTLAGQEKQAVRARVTPEQLKRLPPPKNIVGLGALLRLVNAPLEPAEQYVKELFARKGEAIVEMNISALHSGARHIAEQIESTGKRAPKVNPRFDMPKRLTLNGNQMLAMGAISAGCRFYSGYPITPATEIMEFLAKELPRFGGSVVQAEDEISALGMCLGSSYAGVKTMTASSGPGISLMVEMINLAGQSELPVVIADVQRGGASTGMPTKTSQGDLNLALYGVHNESPRIVIAPTSVTDCYWTAVDAFNLAEAYQCPVILLSDQALATRKSTIEHPDLSKLEIVDRIQPNEEEVAKHGYMRFLDTPSGISPMSIPGMPGAQYVNSGIEHDESGDPGYTPELATASKEKRFRKLETCRIKEGAKYVRYFVGRDETVLQDIAATDVGIIAFGSTEGVIREASQRAINEGFSVAQMQVRLLNPLPVEQIEQFVSKCKTILIPELNFSGQFANWIRVNTRFEFETLHKDEGLPFIPNELYQKITALAGR